MPRELVSIETGWNRYMDIITPRFGTFLGYPDRRLKVVIIMQRISVAIQVGDATSVHVIGSLYGSLSQSVTTLLIN